MGSHHTGESFGDDFVLPPDRAYSETCASVASIMLAWRLLLAAGESRFADLIERTLYNVVATSPSPDGRSFFYANPLRQRQPGAVPDPGVESRRAASTLREPWFRVACCPTNLARTLASLAAYVATADDHGIQIHQYATGTVSATLPGGRRVGVDVATDYPTGGTVTVRVAETDGRPLTLTLRVPSWAAGARLAGPMGEREVGPGPASVEAPFAPGDTVTLTLPMAPRWTTPDPRIDAVRGCAAVERGPVVYCIESVDLPAADLLDSVEVDTTTAPRDDDGAVVVGGHLATPPERDWPYADGAPERAGDDRPSGKITMRPYHSWATRGPASMRVWVPATPRSPGPAPSTAVDRQQR
jgi:DUF1680 family protein